ncbi:MAG: ABC transporter permease [Cryobacterium sp.]|nr:ABC transporter permease [Oligoflexia bacterium]
MTTATSPITQEDLKIPLAQGKSLWQLGFARLRRDKFAVVCTAIILFYFIIAALSKLNVIASPWDLKVAESYARPSGESFRMWLGADIFGRSVMYKTIYGTRTAIGLGLVVAAISVPIGVILGAIAGYFGGWIDDLIVWFYTTLSSIPNLLLLIAISFALGKGLTAVYIALISTSWIGMARVMRGEFMKHKDREYVLAADSLGASHFSKIFKHILPNVSHFIILNFSMQFMSAIKAEVILTFLGVGIQGTPSWGNMIDDAKLELARGVWWQLTGATVAMFFIVLAFNILGDSLRDALDPKIK